MLTNPDCWKTCSNMNESHTGDQYPFNTNLWPDPLKVNVKKVVKTIEKYGPTGEYLGKEVVTEETYDEVPQLSPQPWYTPQEPYRITCDVAGNPIVQGTTCTAGIVSNITTNTAKVDLNDINVHECCR